MDRLLSFASLGVASAVAAGAQSTQMPVAELGAAQNTIASTNYFVVDRQNHSRAWARLEWQTNQLGAAICFSNGAWL